jgi:hypothetical protein
MSLALGSYWGIIPSVLTILGLVVRLFDEEKFLAKLYRILRESPLTSHTWSLLRLRVV